MFSDEHTANHPDVNPDEGQARDNGWLLISRCIFDHPIVGARAGGPRPSKTYPNPISYGWAWIWLIREASFKTRTKVVGGTSYKLAVGDLVCSEAFMGEAWGWSPKAVRHFLAKLGAHKMLKWGTQKGRQIRTLTVCNYAEYQFTVVDAGHSQGHTEGEKRATTRKKVLKNESKTPPTPSRGDEPELPFMSEAETRNNQKVGHDTLTKVGNAPAQEASEVRVAFDRWNQVAKDCSLPAAKSLTEGRAKKIRARLRDGGLADWDKALTEVARSKFMRGMVKPRDGQKPFKADLEFVLQEKSFNRLVEGFYTRNASDVLEVAPRITDAQRQAQADAMARARADASERFVMAPIRGREVP